MISFDFYNPTHIVFGSGSIDKLSEQKLPGKKALLLISSGKSPKASGAYDKTIAQLEKAGVKPEFIRFSTGIENIEDIIADIDQALEKV